MVRSFVALGSNLGDRMQHMKDAVAAIDKEPNCAVSHVSALYETAPVGGPENQGPFLNAAMEIETTLKPQDLLRTLHRIESDHRRERVIPWGPRTLDLDLLLYGDIVSDKAELTLPHPRMHQRRFVMTPLCDLAADLKHPRTGYTMKQHLDMLPEEAGELRRVASDWAEPPQERA